MDEWLEEDEPVYTHPRDPDTRVDILASSRHVRVELDGVTVAESPRPHILFETGLPLPESQKIAGLACFYNEKVDLYVDGELLQRPHTKFG